MTAALDRNHRRGCCSVRTVLEVEQPPESQTKRTSHLSFRTEPDVAVIGLRAALVIVSIGHDGDGIDRRDIFAKIFL